MNAEALILDGYVDEPACLGVPPYISPYIRTIAGVLAGLGYQPRYHTIDQVRKDPLLLSASRNAVVSVMIAGVTVPGKYLGGTPASLTEIQQLGRQLPGKKFVGGPIGFGYSAGGGQKAIRQAISGFDHLLEGSQEDALFAFLSGETPPAGSSYARYDSWAVEGAGIIRQHPGFPWVMCELETARGCSRSYAGGCSFCTEPFYGPPRYRSAEGVATEVRALYEAGARHFRLGRQPDLLTFQAGTGEFPRPRPDRLEVLFSGVREAAPGLQTLHIDNVNPGTIARHGDAARDALRVVVAYHTPGDVAALGMETADPRVVEANNLKASPGDVMEAIRVVNQVGGQRKDGIPELLPGLNFVTGLAGETPLTFDLNEHFLKEVLASGLLVRRVNIRQLMPFEGTRAYTDNTLGLHQARFRKFKEFVREKFDHPMLQQVFPAGTLLRDVVIEEEGNVSFGRQMGSYPILVGIPLPMTAGAVIDAAVVDWGSRSVTALPVPVRVNALPSRALAWIPGIGKKKAGTLAVKRPFRDLDAFRAVAGETVLDPFLDFTSP
ncbi:radical SAM superfamily enzyme with C-terminal helix-hairpin-helix motif [Methanolinea mesophila]|uniref:radical SAM protein n=1 Tax=Methanolinea mesophila TaxID=547055 RepID=UPI001AE62F7D|nr:radical SAM protein [Methanolinea mesophila]MBP1929858.1 radical SAM superfamily enzyme with C-terminal helix-hairpin-helix motif [Methanolinea mesophila]